ncbi:hypothetical protein HK100_009198, partial [Physocladia obscura]
MGWRDHGNAISSTYNYDHKFPAKPFESFKQTGNTITSIGKKETHPSLRYKIKCDGNQSCANCTKANIICSYERNSNKDVKPPKQVAQNKKQKRDNSSSALPVPVSDFLRSENNQTIDLNHNAPFSFQPPIQNGAFVPNIPPFMDQSTMMLAGSVSQEQFRYVASTSTSSSLTPAPAAAAGSAISIIKQMDPVSQLPKDASNELIDIYFEYFDPSMQFLHEKTLRNNIEKESPLLLNAIYALSARYSKHPSVLAIGRMFSNSGGSGSITDTTEVNDDEARQCACDCFYFKARDLVDKYMDFAQSSTIAAFIILKALCAASGRISASWMYSGMAVSQLKEMRRGPTADDYETSDGVNSVVVKK